MDFGVIINSIISILESKASFITTVAFEVGFSVLLYKHPDNETCLFWVIVLGVALVLRGFFYWYDNSQSKKRIEEKKSNINERRLQAKKERQEQEFAEAKYVYDRLNLESQNLLYNITRIAIKSSLEGSYIIKNPYEYQQFILDFQFLLSNDYTLADWVEVDENGDSFCFTIKSPLNKIIEREKY